MATTATPYRPRRVRLRDGREVTLRAVKETDAAEIEQAFERLSADSRYNRFMQNKKQIDGGALARGVHPRPGRDFTFVSTVPAADGFDIVGAAQYVPAADGHAADSGDGDDHANGKTCEFAITVAEDWRGAGLAAKLLASLLRRAQRDGYQTMEGWVVAQNAPMLALARELGFETQPVPGDATVVRVRRAL